MSPTATPRRVDRATGRANRSVGSGVLVGVGVAAFVDETAFHQLLHWHHFYDRSTPAVGLVSDGWLHTGGFIAIVVGMYLLADLRRRRGLVPRRWWAGLLLGWGVFQLYDGLVDHKLLRLHQIRYHVTLWPYDLVWNVLAVIGILIGLVLLVGPARAEPAGPPEPPEPAGPPEPPEPAAHG
jgi:uncharacterized membrane protein